MSHQVSRRSHLLVSRLDSLQDSLQGSQAVLRLVIHRASPQNNLQHAPVISLLASLPLSQRTNHQANQFMFHQVNHLVSRVVNRQVIRAWDHLDSLQDNRQLSLLVSRLQCR